MIFFTAPENVKSKGEVVDTEHSTGFCVVLLLEYSVRRELDSEPSPHLDFLLGGMSVVLDLD